VQGLNAATRKLSSRNLTIWDLTDREPLALSHTRLMLTEAEDVAGVPWNLSLVHASEAVAYWAWLIGRGHRSDRFGRRLRPILPSRAALLTRGLTDDGLRFR